MTPTEETNERPSGYQPDTVPDYWACRICNVKEAHVHQVYNRKNDTWHHEDHGYDIRYEER